MQSENGSTKSALTLSRRRALQLAGAAVLAPTAAVAQQSYPTGPVQVIIPLPPGGVVDVLARGLSDRFRKSLGHPFIIENAPGAAGVLGTSRVARARPDGSTVLLTISSPITTSMFMMKNMPYDPDKDLAPVVIITQVVDALVVHKSLPVNTLQEYIAYAKENPGKLAFGSPGVSSPHHISGEYMSSLTGIKLVHVPYKGSTEATADVIAGHVPSAIVALGGVLEQAKAGTVKILAVTDDTRTSSAPDVPTIGEIVPGFANAPAPWTGMFVPAATPKEVIATLNREMNEALKDPEFAARLKDLVLTPVGGTPEDLATKIRYEREITKKLLGQLGISPQ